jgi:hypothetical protein
MHEVFRFVAAFCRSNFDDHAALLHKS